MIRAAESVRDVVALSGGDALFAWAAGGRRHFGWTSPDVIGVLGTDLSERDRLMVAGHPEAISVLADHVLAEHHLGVRVNGDAALISALGEIRPDLVLSDEFGWMQLTAAQVRRPRTSVPATVEWLPPSADKEVDELLAASFPASEAKPGGSGVRRWAGIRQGGELLAVACEAWSAPGLGFMAGVATARAARERGLARVVCAFVLDQLAAEYGRVALMVDSWNTAAIRLYTELGLTWRPIRSARHRSVPSKNASTIG